MSTLRELHDETIESGPDSMARRLLGLGFGALVACGPLLFWLTDPVETVAWVREPEWRWSSFRSGEFTDRLGRYWKESSPLTVALRGVHNDGRAMLGVYESDQVLITRGGWLFLKDTLDLDVRAMARGQDTRTRALHELRAACERLDVRLLALPVPDRARVHPELCFADGRMPEPRRGHYAELLAELAAAPIEALDLAAFYAARRRERPEELQFYRRDTHWTPAATLAAAELAARRIAELGWDRGLGTPQPFEALPMFEVDYFSDLAKMLGFFPDGPFERPLHDDYAALELGALGPAGTVSILPTAAPDAPVALCGDSFGVAMERALAGVLGRRVDTEGVLEGSGPFVGLAETLRRIRDGELHSRVVVWVFIERSRTENSWRKMPEFPPPR